MDPYVEIEYAGQTYQTTTIQEGGKNPIWNDTLTIQLKGATKAGISEFLKTEQVKITCFDEDLLTDDLVGSSTFTLS